ncbi:hypothetical protein [Coleofasciculus sp. FACHB-T130]|uniref:hypothetical protein n=1 Tax=Cyanophyceae TaxID=3028117 RepID=UPI0016892008|nr:hypothetical protein [Coleofasciculus sp. FACHB-T130]MBD1879766.1 hypothetical protein [Coleofasciculus sp. FACHB-T130]
MTVTLTTLSLFTGTILSLSKPASADEVYLDNGCRRNQALRQDDRFVVFYKTEFRANRQKYWFSAARYQDGAALFCISKPYFKEPRPLGVRQIEDQFIDKIVKASNSNAAFLITVAEGNGSNPPMTVYRLNLINPNKPVLTLLRRSNKR